MTIAINKYLKYILLFSFTLVGGNSLAQNSIGLFYTPASNPVLYGPSIHHSGNLTWNHRFDTVLSLNMGLGYERFVYDLTGVAFDDNPGVPYDQQFDLARLTLTLQMDLPISKSWIFYGLSGLQWRQVLHRNINTLTLTPEYREDVIPFNLCGNIGFGVRYETQHLSFHLEPTYIMSLWTNKDGLESNYFFSRLQQFSPTVGISFH